MLIDRFFFHVLQDFVNAKGYTGVIALLEFQRQAGMPQPTIVHSSHCAIICVDWCSSHLGIAGDCASTDGDYVLVNLTIMDICVPNKIQAERRKIARVVRWINLVARYSFRVRVLEHRFDIGYCFQTIG